MFANKKNDVKVAISKKKISNKINQVLKIVGEPND